MSKNMGLQTTFDALSRVVDRYESEEGAVRRVEASTEGDEGTLRVRMEVPVSLDGEGTAGGPESATLTDAGRLRVEFRTPEPIDLPETPGVAVSAATRDVSVTEGELRRTVELAVSPTTADADAGAVLDGPSSRPESTTGGTDEAAGARIAERIRSGDGPDGDDGRGGPDADAGSEPAEQWGGTARSEDSLHGATDRGAAGAEAGTDGGATASDDRRTSRTDDDASGGDDRVADSLAAARDESVPPYDDAAYLRRLYDVCDTFTEMSRRIEMDVAAETVRRYMIDAGVHEPTSYETSAAGDGDAGGDGAEPANGSETGAEADPADDGATDPSTVGGDARSDGVDGTDGDGPDADEAAGARAEAETSTPNDDTETDPLPTGRLVTDGVGLPDGLRTTDVADAVVESATLYEVQRRLGLDRERARSLLERLDLLDLVVRRLADASDREVGYEEVAARLRECPATGT